jgi:integrase/recombinase XerD
MQLKHGTRAGEVSNMRLEDIHISHRDIEQLYPSLGANPVLDGQTDIVYIPHDRDGNKSVNPRLLPIDEELRWLLIRHLLTRTSVDEPWLFLSKRTFTKTDSEGINDEWKKAFHPKYAETEDYAAITSHFGRHWFSTHFRLNASMQREHVQYIRGDHIAPEGQFPETIDEYLHPNYEQIESTYRSKVFKLNLQMEYGLL